MRATSASSAAMDQLQADIGQEWRREVMSLSQALWQQGEMHLDGPDTLAARAVDHLRERGWLMPDLWLRSQQSFNKLWCAYLIVAVQAVICLGLALWGWLR